MVPRLRFKDENGGDFSNWDRSQFCEIVERIKKRNNGVSRNVLTISAQYGLINQEEYFNKSVASSNSDNYYLLKKGDFAYNKSYSKGYPLGAIKRLTSYEEGIVSPLYICFRSRRIIHNDFLSLYFDSQKINAQLYKIVQEGARNHGLLNMSIDDFFNSIYLVIPSLQEQKKIASFLSSVDHKISQLEKKKTLLETYKRGIMQKIFSQKIRFKDENGEEFPKWEEKRLGDIAALIKDGSHGTHKDYPASKYYLLSAKNIKEGKLVYDETDRRISESDYFSIYKNYNLKKGDILLTIVGTIGNVAIIRDEENIAFQRSVAILRFLYMDSLFSSYIFQDQLFQRILMKKKVVSAQPGIYLGELGKIMIRVPCTKEQQKIALFLSSIDQKIEITSTQLDKTREFKKGLLQQMFV